MTLIQFLADRLQLTEVQAAEFYDLREHLAALASTRALRDLSLRRFNHHLETIASMERKPNTFLAFKRGRAQEALEFPDIVRSLHESLLSAVEDYKEQQRLSEETP